MTPDFTLGVEEEFFVVDPATCAVAIDGQSVMDHLPAQSPGDKGAGFGHELHLSILESRTAICQGLGQLRAELQQLRATLIQAAEESGRWIVAAGTPPLGDWRQGPLTPEPRYEQMVELFQQMARRQFSCACHVHVGMSDRESAVQTLNRVRPWLPALLALSVSSPFSLGSDTGYASYRSILWGSWPTGGIPRSYQSADEYLTMVQSLINAGIISHAGQIYWDARLSHRYNTIEFRIADACSTIDEAVLQAGLCQALTQTCRDEATSGRPLPELRPELLAAAKWQAARYGLKGSLLDVQAAEAVPATVLLNRFLAYVRPALEDTGNWDEIAALLEQTQRRGTSAERQRRTFCMAQCFTDVVNSLRVETFP